MARLVPLTDPPPSLAGPSLYFAVRGQELLVGPDGTVQPLSLAPAGGSAPLFLGTLDGLGCWGVAFEEEEAAPPGFTFQPLRRLAGALDDVIFGAAGRALMLLEWRRAHAFCGRCGTPTQPVIGERALKCPACAASHYPRLSPAVIGSVEKEGRILLARNGSFPRPFYSTLAGFVEAGESLEAAFAREVEEEVGLQVKEVRYFGSQPWPFSSSIMIGFTAVWASGEIVVDGKEIVDAQWFSPEALPAIPPKGAIARSIIEAFVARRG